MQSSGGRLRESDQAVLGGLAPLLTSLGKTLVALNKKKNQDFFDLITRLFPKEGIEELSIERLLN